MSSALARYMKQQAADRLAVQQRGAALRESEQEARSRAAAEAPRVLYQLEAEARCKIAMAVSAEPGDQHQIQQHQANSSSCMPGVPIHSSSTPGSSKKHHSRTAVWPASAAGSSSSSICQTNGPMHVAQPPLQPPPQQQQQQPGLLSQAGNLGRQPVAAAHQPCRLQERASQAAHPNQQHRHIRQQAWHPQQQHGQADQQQQQQQQQQHTQQQQIGACQPFQQQWHQPHPPKQHALTSHTRQMDSSQHQQQQLQQHGRMPRSCSNSSGALPQRNSSRDCCRPAAAGRLLQPLLPQQSCTSGYADTEDGSTAQAGAAVVQQPSVMLRRPGSPISQVLCALACHAAAPRVAAAAPDPLKEPLLGQ